MKMNNPNCDGAYCRAPDGETRLLPLSSSSNLNLCRTCFEFEMNFRRSENARLGPDSYPLPDWESLPVQSQPELGPKG
jgi:hypothetical protein